MRVYVYIYVVINVYGSSYVGILNIKLPGVAPVAAITTAPRLLIEKCSF